MTVVAFIAALCCVLIAPAVAASRAGWRHGPVDLPVPLAMHSEVWASRA